MTHIDQIPEAAIERLWREHSTDLVGLATMLVGPADAHDIAVAAFLRAAPAADRPEVSNARAFLMRSVVNRAHDLRRSNERRWRRDLAAVGPASTSGPDSFVDVRRAVSKLSLAQRSVVYTLACDDVVVLTVADRPTATYSIQPGDTWESIAAAQGILLEDLLDANGLTLDTLEATGETVASPIDPGRAITLLLTPTLEASPPTTG